VGGRCWQGGRQREEEVFGTLTKKQKIDEAESEKERKEEDNEEVGDGFISRKEQVLSMSEEEFEAFLRAKAKEISNMAADEVIRELAEKVMEEKDEDQQGQEEIGEEAGVLLGADRSGEMTGRTREVEAVLKACKGQTRASPRLQRSRDEHVLVKAKKRAAKKNLEFKDGKSPSPPLLYVSSDLALHCLHQLGLNLGSSDLEQNNNLCNSLDRGKGGVMSELGDTDNERLGWDSEEDSCEEVEKRALRSLCGELVEEIFDESSFPLNSELDGFKRKDKSHAKSCLSKTCKIRRVKFLKGVIK
jgi:hypothetical protein